MKIELEEKTINTLKWIVSILNKHKVPYRIGGGFAAYIFGSNRKVNDLDISISGEYFPVILSDVKEYIIAGPKHYLNEKWNCNTLSLNYQKQDIDLTDIDTLLMTNKEKTEWIQVKNNFRKYPPKKLIFENIEISLMDPRDLIGYKKHLDGEHQLIDIQAVEEYIKNN